MSTKSSNISQLTFIFCLIVIGIQSCSANIKYQTSCKKHNPDSSSLEYKVIEVNKTRRDASEYVPANVDYYQCPGDNYNHTYQYCCGVNECCQAKKTFITNISSAINDDKSFAIMIAVVVVCLLVVIGLAFCFFLPFCPLHNTCRIRYYRDESSCTDKLGEITNISLMPDDEPISNTVIISKMFDSDQIDEKKVIHGKEYVEAVKITKMSDEFMV